VASVEKAPGAFLTIGELSNELGVAQHILRYWESKFPQLKPLQRAGNRRYYRSDDVALARRINRLLNEEGYTVRGVQKLLRDRSANSEIPKPAQPDPSPPPEDYGRRIDDAPRLDVGRLVSIRDSLASALGD
jgi:DNA-binding transcriptional MerR regulator